MSSSPLVTVVIPAFNAEPFIGEAIASVQRQTLEDWQLIVVDDGSTDQTLSAARQAAGDDKRIRLIRFDRNEGISAASNAGFDAARGEFIARVDSDDRAVPHRLAAQVAAFRENERLAAAGSHASVFGDVPDGVAYCAQGDGNIKARLLDGLNTISGGTLMVRRAFVRAHGVRFDDCARSAEDLDYLTLVMAAGGQLANVDEVLTEHRSHPGSFTNSQTDIAGPWLQTARRRLLALWYPDLDPRDIERIVILFLNVYPGVTDELFAIVKAIDRLVSARAADFGQDVAIVHEIVLDRMTRMLGIYQDNKVIDASQIRTIRHFVAPQMRAALDKLSF
ncbi:MULTISPECIES: glycosyltransferase family A protein [unclassified Caballeronia]|uniref:glycosyltransferase family 2 protein n=1 Tax=unclassified Caballeronia TaxID=2646786 RepID=UPI00285C21A9|nr:MULTISPECIES: glycosyltransferase family A protein [unclassified Caballeronia]MDR5739043.1 glycosyltransferase family A protein [Caballeronia sp. LZ016]MDR5807531.1 glycosyltransferase family A protein [Caballeronia sp. LZ019]